MDKDTAIFLGEEFYKPRLRVQLHCPTDGRRELLFGKLDACDLGIEGASNEGAEEGVVCVVRVERWMPGGVVSVSSGEKTAVGEGGEVLGTV